MIRRAYRTEESQVRYWADQAVELCQLIDDDTLNEYIAPVEEARAALERDRRVLVIGGQGSGKSSLLSGLAESPVPATAKWDGSYVRWRYRSTDGEHAYSRFLPLENLDGLELVDTRSCAEEKVLETIPELAAGADVIIATMDARSMESSPVWNALAALPPELHHACLLALTFADTMPAAATLELGKRVLTLCREKLGDTLRFLVCNPTSQQSLADFSAHVQAQLDGPRGVLSAIRTLSEKSGTLDKRQESILTARSAVARTDTVFMGNIEQEIDNFLSRQRTGVPGLVETYSGVVTKAMPRLQHNLRKTLGLWLSPVTILRLELLAAGTEKCLYSLLCEEIMRLQKDADSQFVISCESHWKSVRPRMTKTLACEIGEFPQSALQSQLDSLRTELCNNLHEPFMRLRLRQELAKFFNAPAGWMLTSLWIICFFLFLSGILGFIGQDLPALGCVGAAAVVWLFASLAHLVYVHHTLAGVSTCTDMLAQGLREALVERAEKFIVSRVTAYRVLYIKPRETVAMHAKLLRPLQDRHNRVNIGIKDAQPRHAM